MIRPPDPPTRGFGILAKLGENFLSPFRMKQTLAFTEIRLASRELPRYPFAAPSPRCQSDLPPPPYPSSTQVVHGASSGWQVTAGLARQAQRGGIISRTGISSGSRCDSVRGNDPLELSQPSRQRVQTREATGREIRSLA